MTAASVDRRILYTTAFLRAVATGMIAVLLAAYLAVLHFPADVVGWVVAAGLAGNAAALALTTVGGDRIDRKRVLLALAALGAAGAALAWFSRSPAALAASAFVGMLNGMGRDRGAALALEQAILPATTTEGGRTQAFAWYNALQDTGHALGALAAGLPALLEHSTWNLSPGTSHRLGLAFYGCLALVCVALYARLSPSLAGTTRAAPLSPQSRRVLGRICALFALDSAGGGFLTTALVTYFFFERFGAGEGVVALLFFGARIANVVSHFGAARLARRYGLVNTMVFTHAPSSLLLVTVAFAPSFAVAAVLFLLREGLVEMDVPTRQSYVMALVGPEERGRASSATNLVRMAGWPITALAGGFLMARTSIVAPLVIGAGMKLAYDAILYRAFRRIQPPEEQGSEHHARPNAK
ncbi:MAG TPA: MFS transporter [Polyangiaceae bacterium]